MREEIVKCNECKGIIDGEVITLPNMRVIISAHGKIASFNCADRQEIEMVEPPSKGGLFPDFCGVPCLLKWISSKIDMGNKGGDAG